MPRKEDPSITPILERRAKTSTLPPNLRIEEHVPPRKLYAGIAESDREVVSTTAGHFDPGKDYLADKQCLRPTLPTSSNAFAGSKSTVNPIRTSLSATGFFTSLAIF